MRCISICAFNRPDLLIKCLDSIKRNKLTDWNLYVSIEPGCKEVEDIVRSITFIPVTYQVNGRVLGVDLNTFISFYVPFSFGSNTILHIEDDIVLSPDAIELCSWYLNDIELRSNGNAAGLCLCNKDENDPNLPNNIYVSTWMGLVGQGYCITSYQWDRFVKPNFWLYKDHYGGKAWDWSVTHAAIDNGKQILRPRLSRSMHMGTSGMHGGPTFPDSISQQTDTEFVLE